MTEIVPDFQVATVVEEYGAHYTMRYEEDGWWREQRAKGKVVCFIPRKTLAFGANMNWECPQCHKRAVYAYNMAKYTTTHAVQLVCTCGATIFLSIKAPTMRVYTVTPRVPEPDDDE